MATVPRYNRQVVAEAPRNYEIRGQATPEAFGGGSGQNIIKQATEFASAYQKAKDDADNVVIKDASYRAKQEINNFLYNPENGALNTKGKNAVGVFEGKQTNLLPKIEEIKKGLTKTQQVKFNAYLQEQDVFTNASLNKHMAKEQNAFDEEATVNFIKAEQLAAVVQIDNPEYVDTSIEIQKQAVLEKAQRNGYSAARTQLEVLKVGSDTRVGLINNMIDSENAKTAKDYYDTHKDSILPDERSRIEKALKVGVMSQDAQDASDDIFSRFQDQTAGIKEVNKIKDFEMREETKKRLMQRYQEADTAERLRENDNYLYFVNQQENNPNTDPKSISPSKWVTLSLDKRNALEKRFRGEDQVNDNDKWIEFLELGKNDPSKLKNMTRAEFESTYWQNFDASHKTKAENLWTKGLGSDQSKQNFTNVLTVPQRVKNTMVANGLFRKETSDSKIREQNQRMALLTEEVGYKVEEFETKAGRKATGSEVQEQIDKVLLDNVKFEKSKWFGLRTAEDQVERVWATPEQLENEIKSVNDLGPQAQERLTKIKNRTKSVMGYNLYDQDAIAIDQAMQRGDNSTVDAILAKYKK